MVHIAARLLVASILVADGAAFNTGSHAVFPQLPSTCLVMEVNVLDCKSFTKTIIQTPLRRKQDKAACIEGYVTEKQKGSVIMTHMDRQFCVSWTNYTQSQFCLSLCKDSFPSMTAQSLINIFTSLTLLNIPFQHFC